MIYIIYNVSLGVIMLFCFFGYFIYFFVVKVLVYKNEYIYGEKLVIELMDC